MDQRWLISRTIPIMRNAGHVFDVLGYRNLLQTRSGAQVRGSAFVVSPAVQRRCQAGTPGGLVRIVSEADTEIVSDAIVRRRSIETQYQIGPLVRKILDLLHIQIKCIANDLLVRNAMAMRVSDHRVECSALLLCSPQPSIVSPHYPPTFRFHHPLPSGSIRRLEISGNCR